MLHHRYSTELYIGLRKYWNVQSEGKVEQTIAIVTTCSVFLLNFQTCCNLKIRGIEFFVTFILTEENIFNICVLSQCMVYLMNFLDILLQYTFTYQKIYFIHFCCLKVLCYLQFSKNTNMFESYQIPSNDWIIQYYQQYYEDFAMERCFAV